jgi:agmatine deiminase
MPAEFEPIEAVWLTYPHESTTWPGCIDAARQQYDFFMSQVARFARVELIGPRWRFPTDDSWIRDYGPLFVITESGQLACHDFIFNAWGEKYDNFEDDDRIPQHIARQLDIPIWVHDMVLEGGSVDVNGLGTLLTTEQCLLNDNRNPHLMREEIEDHLRRTLCAHHVIWLPGGIDGDDTDGHVDDVARFANPTTILAVRALSDHPDHEMLERNFEVLRRSVDQDGHAFELMELPAVPPIVFDYPPDRYSQGGPCPLPASYANFLIVNDAVLVPTFDKQTDDAALDVIQRAFPRRHVVGVRSEWLVVGLGALHCLSMQQPKVL